MLGDISVADEIYIICGYTDMRRSIDGLCAIVQDRLHMDPRKRALYLFCGKRCDRLKALLWEGDGFLLLYKRMEAQGRFRWPRNSEEVSRAEDSLLGKTLHINFTNLGTTYKAGFTEDISGEWDYALSLPMVCSMEEVAVGEEVTGTVFEVETVEISPVAVKVNYAVNGEVEIVDDDLEIPQFCGFVLEDGTRLTCIADGGMSGYTNEAKSGAYCISAFDRVIATGQITALLIRTEDGLQTVEITPSSH